MKKYLLMTSAGFSLFYTAAQAGEGVWGDKGYFSLPIRYSSKIDHTPLQELDSPVPTPHLTKSEAGKEHFKVKVKPSLVNNKNKVNDEKSRNAPPKASSKVQAEISRWSNIDKVNDEKSRSESTKSCSKVKAQIKAQISWWDNIDKFKDEKSTNEPIKSCSTVKDKILLWNNIDKIKDEKSRNEPLNIFPSVKQEILLWEERSQGKSVKRAPEFLDIFSDEAAFNNLETYIPLKDGEEPEDSGEDYLTAQDIRSEKQHEASFQDDPESYYANLPWSRAPLVLPKEEDSVDGLVPSAIPPQSRDTESYPENRARNQAPLILPEPESVKLPIKINIEQPKRIELLKTFFSSIANKANNFRKTAFNFPVLMKGKILTGYSLIKDLFVPPAKEESRREKLEKERQSPKIHIDNLELSLEKATAILERLEKDPYDLVRYQERKNASKRIFFEKDLEFKIERGEISEEQAVKQRLEKNAEFEEILERVYTQKTPHVLQQLRTQLQKK